ncbi:MAG: hypothetical protein M5T61_01320 [Acidimicrobiia bacterium]|nr:hypothetical protein [Acidimicrobiia bacterium]
MNSRRNGGVVYVEFVDELVDHAEDQSGICSRADRHPLLGPRSGRAAYGVDRHDLHVVIGAAVTQLARRVHRVVVHDGAELRPDQHDVLRVLRIGDAFEGILVHVADAVDVVAAEDRGRPRRVARHAGAEDERRHHRSAQVVRVEARVHQPLRVVLNRLADLRGDLVERLFPADLLPTGIDSDAPLGIGATQRLGDAVGVAQALEARVALGARPPVIVRILRVTQDLVHDTVFIDVREDPATIEANDARRAHPAVTERRPGPLSEERVHQPPPTIRHPNPRKDHLRGHTARGAPPAPGGRLNGDSTRVEPGTLIRLVARRS